MTRPNGRPRGPVPGATGRSKPVIARIATAAHNAGVRMSVAVATHYGINEPAASVAISRARFAGYAIPTDRPRRNDSIRHLHASVAAYRRHLLAGETPCPACAPFAEASREASIRYAAVARAARSAALAESPGVVVRPAKPRTSMLRCACGHCTDVDPMAMARHTLSEHRRPPTATERTPVAA